MPNNESTQQRIVLFAGPGAGKTGLLRAFLYITSYEKYRKAFSGSPNMDVEVEYADTVADVDKGNWKPVMADITSLNSTIEPSTTLSAKHFKITRRPKSNNHTSIQQQVSASCQYLHLIDDMGGLYDIAKNNDLDINDLVSGNIPTNYLKDTTGKNLDPQQIKDAWSNLISADVLIVLLDPTQHPEIRKNRFEHDAQPASTSMPDSQSSERTNVGNLESQAKLKSQYESQLGALLHRLIEIRSLKEHAQLVPEKTIAICCVKMDDPSVKANHAAFEAVANTNQATRLTLFEEQFGVDVKEAIVKLQQIYGTVQTGSKREASNAVRLFLLSSTGWYKRGNNRVSNHASPSSGTFVSDPGKWEPIGVHDLFCWIFNRLDHKLRANNLAKVNWFASALISNSIEYRNKWIKWGNAEPES